MSRLQLGWLGQLGLSMHFPSPSGLAELVHIVVPRLQPAPMPKHFAGLYVQHICQYPLVKASACQAHIQGVEKQTHLFMEGQQSQIAKGVRRGTGKFIAAIL